MIMVGDPAHCIARLNAYHEAGIDHILCLMQLYDIPHDKIMQSINLFGEHVLPHFGATASPFDRP